MNEGIGARLFAYIVVGMLISICISLLIGCGEFEDEGGLNDDTTPDPVVESPVPTGMPSPVPTGPERVSTNPDCNGVMEFRDGPGQGNLAKNGDHTGRAVILFSGKYQSPFSSVELEKPDGSFDSFRYTGCPDVNTDSDGRCRQHWRGNRKLSRYKRPSASLVARDGEQTCTFRLRIKKGVSRID